MRALQVAVRTQGAEGYSVVTRYSLRAGTTVRVVLKFQYADDCVGDGATLRVAAQRALCSAGLR